MTLLHEMGHAAGADLVGFSVEEKKGSDRTAALRRNFMSHADGSRLSTPRDQMMRWQGEKLATSFFAGDPP